jgi:hypothetical protein
MEESQAGRRGRTHGHDAAMDEIGRELGRGGG